MIERFADAGHRELFETAVCSDLPYAVERVIDRTLLWLALVLVEIRLKLLFGFVRVSYKLPPRPEG
jgi:hypothetical protein